MTAPDIRSYATMRRWGYALRETSVEVVKTSGDALRVSVETAKPTSSPAITAMGLCEAKRPFPR